MEKLYNSSYLLYLTLFFIGGLSTFSLPPFSIFPLILILGFGIHIIYNVNSSKKHFMPLGFLVLDGFHLVCIGLVQLFW